MNIHKPANFIWSFEKCKEDALQYSSRVAWQKAGRAYKAALKNGWLDECCGHMKRPVVHNKKWTLETCKEDALKYQSRSEWAQNSAGYQIAKHNHWLNECCKYMEEKKKPHGYWTLATCKAQGLQYSSIGAWKSAKSSSYSYACRFGWAEECCKHMKKSRNRSESEYQLFSIIKKHFIKTQTIRIATKDFFTNKPHIHRFDIDVYVPELRKGIEFNGDYWHSDRGLKRSRSHWPQEDIDNYHQLKKSFFSSKGIEYIEIKESDWKEDPQTCIYKCLEFLGVT